MPKQAISVTLDTDNLTWLKGRVGGGDAGSVSALLDRLISAARSSGQTGPSRSVVGTIDLDPSDPWLDDADETIRSLFEGSLGRPLILREISPKYGRVEKPRARRG